MKTNDPSCVLKAVDLLQIQEMLRFFVPRVAIKALAFSAGGVEQEDASVNTFVIVLADYHKSRTDLLTTFVHEILHILLFIRFPRADQECFHSQIVMVSDQLAKMHEKELWQLLISYVSEIELIRILPS